jgi:hypothetical protein
MGWAKTMRKKFEKMKIQLIFVAVIAVIILGVTLFLNRNVIYDFSHLTRSVDYGQGREFAPISGVASLTGDSFEDMLPVADNAVMTLFIDTSTSNFAVLDKRNGHVWYSCPPEADDDPIANLFEKSIMRSLFGFRYYDEQTRRFTKWSYADAAENAQFELETIENGVRILYEVGDVSLGINFAPKFIEETRFEERFESQMTNSSDQRFLTTRAYRPSRDKPGFMERVSGLDGNEIMVTRLIDLLEGIGYTIEELMEDNAEAEHEMEIALDYFAVQVEIMLQDDTLIINMPLDKIEATGGERLFFLELMKYFGAGRSDEEGYLLVPSGSGGLIDFNNGKTSEETFISPVYGLDPLMNVLKPQLTTPTRLPVMGIKKENAAMISWVESGAALATINADIAGKNNDYNIAWYSFLIRDYTMMTMVGGTESDMTIVQQEAYEGDITVKYRFVANEDADYTGMALAYQRALVEDGKLTPLTPTANTPFYLDIIGAAEKQKFILGTPYQAIESMTTYAQANEILDLLNDAGVHSVQMRWLGWFNRGINHDVAKKINWTGSVGSRNEMRQLNERLAHDGGGLYPGVNFHTTAWSSRNITRSNEVSRDPSGFLGVMSNYSREFLRTRGPARFTSDWYLIVNPGVLPHHIDSFIPKYNRLRVDNIALNDMGDLISASLYRRNTVDRENSRMITTEQLARFSDTYASIMLTGGNDFALAAADHMINIPTSADRFYLLDHEIPFYQIVVHGYMDYAGSAVNIQEVQDPHMAFLNMMSTGASPHYAFSYQPTRNVEFTAYDRFYSTHYNTNWLNTGTGYTNWLNIAAEQYREYNEVHKHLRTQRIVGHAILSESSSHTSSVTVTKFEDGTRIYVNTTREPYEADGYTVPSLGYHVQRGEGTR